MRSRGCPAKGGDSVDQVDVSFVVPIYNADGWFLDRLLASLAPSAAFTFEVVMVDDGSDERHAALIDERAASLPCPHTVVHQPNGGQNAARNAGVDHARGTWIQFVDADDEIDMDAFEQLMACAKDSPADLVMAGWWKVGPNGRRLAASRALVHGYAPAAREELLLEGDSLCRCLFKRELMVQPGCRLIEGPRIGEDVTSLFALVLAAKRTYASDVRFYRYRVRSGSISRSSRPDLVLDVVKAFEILDGRLGAEAFGCAAEIEWLAIMHVLYLGAIRCIESGAAGADNRQALFSYMDRAHPAWRENPHLKTEPLAGERAFACAIAGDWDALARELKRQRVRSRLRGAIPASARLFVRELLGRSA